MLFRSRTCRPFCSRGLPNGGRSRPPAAGRLCIPLVERCVPMTNAKGHSETGITASANGVRETPC
jgi:hypothetical protein